MAGNIEVNMTGTDLTQFKSKYTGAKPFRYKVYLIEIDIQMIMGDELGLIHFKIVVKGKTVGKAALKLTDD